MVKVGIEEGTKLFSGNVRYETGVWVSSTKSIDVSEGKAIFEERRSVTIVRLKDTNTKKCGTHP